MNRNSYGQPNRSSHDQSYLIVTKKASITDRILLSPIVKYVTPVIAVIVILMTTVYLALYFFVDNEAEPWRATCNIKTSYRVECFPGKEAVSYERCSEVGCCWNDETKLCFHSVPSRHGYTQRDGEHFQENAVLVPRTTSSPLGSKNVDSLLVKINNIDPNHVEIIFQMNETNTRDKRNITERKPFAHPRKFETGKHPEAMLDFLSDNSASKSINLQNDEKSQMNVNVHYPEFSVTVTRKNNVTSSLMSTARGPLILTENYWELTLFITESSLYGLNQLELNGTTNFIYSNENGTARPSFLGIDDDGQGTACYINYDGPMEIKVLDGSNLVVLRGMSLPEIISLHVFFGPTPLEAIGQLTKALRQDNKSQKIPILSLGLHVCPNDDSTEYIDSLKKIIESMKVKEAPWDSHCLHQDFNPSLGSPLTKAQDQIISDALNFLLEGERLLMPHLSAALSTTKNALTSELEDSSLLLKNSSGPYVGIYRKRRVVYPDWFEPQTLEKSQANLTAYLTIYESSKVLYLRDSWPKDESKEHPEPDNQSFDYMPAGLTGLMTNGTVPYNLQASSTSNYHYMVHNNYAEKFRDFVNSDVEWTSLMTRGIQGEAGYSSWTALREAIRVGVGSCLVGQLPPPMYVCGTADVLGVSNKDGELCSRWYGSAVVWPHILSLPSNLPGGDHLTASSSSYAVKLLKLRVSLVTYARTVMAKHYIEGAPILAPTSLHYPKDLWVRRRWDQFFWGDSILIGLVTLPRVSQVLMWLPGKYPWRHLQGGSEVYPSNPTATSITAVAGQIISLIRPGFIVPVHEEISMTSGLTAESNLTLVTNLVCKQEQVGCTASGKIFYGSSSSDGVFLHIAVSQLNNYIQLNNVLEVKRIACSGSPTSPVQQSTLIKDVKILGAEVYTVNIDLCDITGNSTQVSLSTLKNL